MFAAILPRYPARPGPTFASGKPTRIGPSDVRSPARPDPEIRDDATPPARPVDAACSPRLIPGDCSGTAPDPFRPGTGLPDGVRAGIHYPTIGNIRVDRCWHCGRSKPQTPA